MNITTVDARDFPCPKPIIMTKQAVDSANPGEQIQVLINRESAKNNTLRFLQDNNIPAEWKQDGEIFTIHITKPHDITVTENVDDSSCNIVCEL